MQFCEFRDQPGVKIFGFFGKYALLILLFQLTVSASMLRPAIKAAIKLLAPQLVAV